MGTGTANATAAAKRNDTEERGTLIAVQPSYLSPLSRCPALQRTAFFVLVSLGCHK